MRLLLLLLAGCDFSASTKVDADDTAAADSGALVDDGGAAGGGASGGGASGGGASGGGDDGEEPDPADVDDDQDGYTENEGDCDDADPGVRPGQVDGCDGVDEDCDGEADEDAPDEDPYEPNDAAATDLGSLSDDPAHSIEAPLHDNRDVDRYAFDLEDGGWSLFRLDVGLSSIPDDATYRLVVRNLNSGETLYDESGSDSLAFQFDDRAFSEDGGRYEVAVSARGGADCSRRYLLTVAFSD